MNTKQIGALAIIAAMTQCSHATMNPNVYDHDKKKIEEANYLLSQDKPVNIQQVTDMISALKKKTAKEVRRKTEVEHLESVFNKLATLTGAGAREAEENKKAFTQTVQQTAQQVQKVVVEIEGQKSGITHEKNIAQFNDLLKKAQALAQTVIKTAGVSQITRDQVQLVSLNAEKINLYREIAQSLVEVEQQLQEAEQAKKQADIALAAAQSAGQDAKKQTDAALAQQKANKEQQDTLAAKEAALEEQAAQAILSVLTAKTQQEKDAAKQETQKVATQAQDLEKEAKAAGDQVTADNAAAVGQATSTIPDAPDLDDLFGAATEILETEKPTTATSPKSPGKAPAPSASQDLLNAIRAGVGLKKPSSSTDTTPDVKPSGAPTLLDQIKAGTKLKKSDSSAETKPEPTTTDPLKKALQDRLARIKQATESEKPDESDNEGW